MAAAANRDTTHIEPPTVCLVDDDPIMGFLFKRVIQRSGYNVLIASGPSEAVLILADHKVDLVLSDLMMPNYSDGEQLLACVVQNYPSVPVFIMSGNMTPDVEGKLVNMGASGCLEKPFTAEAFTKLISNDNR